MVPISNDQQFAAWIVDNVNIPSIKKVFTAGTVITAGTGVYMSTDGKVYPYTTSNIDTFLGVAQNTTAINCAFVVVMQGYLRVPLSGWQKGLVYYIQNGGIVGLSGDKKMAIGVGDDQVVIINNFGNGGLELDGYAKPLMLMGG